MYDLKNNKSIILQVDKYFTVQPHTLLRQHMDYQHWYDRMKLSLKDIHKIQFVACMNPTAGSFTIDPRLQRHFSVFALSFPATEALYQIYHSIWSQHTLIPGNKFPIAVQKQAPSIVNAALTLHARIAATFLPTAVKFHYVFNLRDLSNIFQGMLFANGEAVFNVSQSIRYVNKYIKLIIVYPNTFNCISDYGYMKLIEYMEIN